MHTSANGLAFISREEGLRLEPYNDSEGHATIGVGHLIHLGNVTAADRAKYRGFNRADATRLLKADVGKVEDTIERVVKVPLNQNEFDALVSLGFNIGTGGLAGSTVVRELNKRHKMRAADAILMWRKPSVLLPRRQRERSLFLKPVVKHTPHPFDYLTKTERHLADQYMLAHGKGQDTTQLRAQLVEARKRIWRAAEHGAANGGRGWDTLHRKQRYAALKSLTTGRHS